MKRESSWLITRLRKGPIIRLDHRNLAYNFKGLTQGMFHIAALHMWTPLRVGGTKKLRKYETIQIVRKKSVKLGGADVGE
jgi:hypothetical protein